MILYWNSADMSVAMSLDDGEKCHEYSWEAGRSLSRDMLAYLRDALAEHGATFDNITAIGVYRGPGSFTGLRIGLTVLNTIATDRGIPIVGAAGESWKADCKERIENGDDDKIVMPEYGGDAHITAPRK